MAGVCGPRRGCSLDRVPGKAGTDGTNGRDLGPEEVQPDAQAQVEETQQGDDLGESFGSVIGYLKHGFQPWRSG